jgi:hypothetical protein
LEGHLEWPFLSAQEAHLADVGTQDNGGLRNGPCAHFFFRAFLRSAAMDGRFLILAIKDERRNRCQDVRSGFAITDDRTGNYER